jgi:hypothetical protein
MFMKGGDESNDYVPEWDNCLEEDTSNEEEDDEMGMEQEMETVHFNVTLMMNQGKQGGEDYEPKDDDDDDGVPVSAPGPYGAGSRSSTPSPPSLEHYRGGFKLPKHKQPKKSMSDDSDDDRVDINKNRNRKAVLTGGTGSMAVPDGS